jgi:hypothetical protein
VASAGCASQAYRVSRLGAKRCKDSLGKGLEGGRVDGAADVDVDRGGVTGGRGHARDPRHLLVVGRGRGRRGRRRRGVRHRG